MDYISLSSLDENLSEPIELQHSSCFYCNGFYGPCFGEPVCGTCHDFMFTENFGSFQSSYSYGIEKDENDSGNDEPSEEAAGPSNNNNNDRFEEVQNPGPEALSPDEEEAPELNDNNQELVVVVEQIPEIDEFMVIDTDDEDEYEPPSPPKWPQAPKERILNRLSLLTTPSLYEAIVPSEDMSVRIPPEIWSAIFKKLDDISLLMASKVSKKWLSIILDQHPNAKWEEYLKHRWPLFQPVYIVNDWYSAYCDLVDSVPCKMCFMNLLVHLPPIERPQSRSLRSVRLSKELKWLKFDHPDGIEAVPLDPYNYNWLARVQGPNNSNYQGGIFYLNLKVPHEYPLKPPIVRFLTKIIHPNISRHGCIGLDSLHHNWTLALTLAQILLSVQSLLTDPFLEASMEPSLAQLYVQDRHTFDKVARIWTWKYAMHDVILH